MDADRFDTLTKRLVRPTTRRSTLGAAAAGGLLSLLGFGRAPETRAAQANVCTLAFVANVRLGPNVETVMTQGARPGELSGELSFGLSQTGNLENATFALADGTRLPVVGQATGYALQMRIALGEQIALVAVGVGERPIADCRGAVDGVATGPEVGDLGDWHAAAARQQGGTGGGGSSGGGSSGGGSSGGGTAPNRCPSGQTRCGNACVNLATDRNHCGACGELCPDMGGLVCAGGRCGCPAGWVDCSGAPGVPQGIDGYCAELNGDPRNCGACAYSCAVGETCVNGFCQGTGGAECAPGLTDCNGVCVDLNSDMDHCGACGEVCESGLVPVECRSGVCERANCPVDQEYCGAVDLCRDLETDPDHCGACGNACGIDQNCEGGVCVAPQCPAGTTDCGGYCADLQTSPVHCGVCGTACTADQICAGGACTAAQPCPAGQTSCGGVCVDLNTDPAHCGECGVGCVAGLVCQGGECINTELQCATDQTLCTDFYLGDVCVNFMTDPVNCGACGFECAYGESCAGGACQPICPGGQSYCNGVCTDTSSDADNCGTCGIPCTGFTDCRGGQCVEVGGCGVACAPPLTACDCDCFDLTSDARHCGACGNSCPLGGICVDRVCQGA